MRSEVQNYSACFSSWRFASSGRLTEVGEGEKVLIREIPFKGRRTSKRAVQNRGKRTKEETEKGNKIKTRIIIRREKEKEKGTKQKQKEKQNKNKNKNKNKK